MNYIPKPTSGITLSIAYKVYKVFFEYISFRRTDRCSGEEGILIEKCTGFTFNYFLMYHVFITFYKIFMHCHPFLKYAPNFKLVSNSPGS